MNPIDWLSKNSIEFNNLSKDEREAIMHFTLLWSYFEARALDNNASSNGILALAHKWQSIGKLSAAPFATSLKYFQSRYFNNSVATVHYAGLHLRMNDSPELVETVLKDENMNPEERIAVLLIVVYRLRNNLFHGIKWNNAIHDQLDNFKYANIALMAAMETHKECGVDDV